ncbi:MAG: RNA methyltransferase [Prolixibacteraceae bacterium]|nr:RNA methyltransferase [Prolixibacteraceae bacterium]
MQENLFLAEGNKTTSEFLKSDFKIQTLICTENYFENTKEFISDKFEIILATTEEIKKCSLQKNPQESMVLCELPETEFDFNFLRDDLVICLDNIQDPGNLGTIIRIADWYGIKTICASKTTADVYNPKVVQASMGSIIRVNIYYTDLIKIIQYANQEEIPTYGTFLDGRNIFSEKLPENAIFVMGNEGNGISAELEPLLNNRLCIPSLKTDMYDTIDSLNVSVATAIVCSEFRRSKFPHYSK